jgi:hypothetical protein
MDVKVRISKIGRPKTIGQSRRFDGSCENRPCNRPSRADPHHLSPPHSNPTLADRVKLSERSIPCVLAFPARVLRSSSCWS